MMGRQDDAIGALCELAMRLIDASAVDRVCAALENGELAVGSTSAIRSRLAEGSPRAEAMIRELQKLWTDAYPSFGGDALSVALRAAAAGVRMERRLSPKTQIVWTGPRVEGSYLRATREVVREIVCLAEKELLVVGYWLAVGEEGAGVIEEVIELLSKAAQRGVDVVVALDARERTTGGTNKTVLMDVWPPHVHLPRLLTWRLPESDRYLKLHAKIMVSDGRDALITSANLTGYAMDRNIEMGIRVVGEPAQKVRDHVRLLESRGILEPF